MKSWLAAYVRLHHEKKTRDRLTAMGIECFLPIQEEIHQWSDRRKKVERVVIPMMIFVRVSDEERGLPLTLSAISRYMVLRGESVPAVIPDRHKNCPAPETGKGWYFYQPCFPLVPKGRVELPLRCQN